MGRTLEGAVRTALVTGLSLIVPSACGGDDDEVKGHCNVAEYDIAADYTERKTYCSTKAECDAFCESVSGLQNYPGCEYDASSESKYCSGGSLPAPKEQRVCALYQSIVCGGGPDAFEPHCDPSCSHESDSDYDPGTDCLTQYRGPVVEGKTCDEALGKLEQ
jgi:hypothetical protein